MRISFESVEELKTFRRAFRLEEREAAMPEPLPPEESIQSQPVDKLQTSQETRRPVQPEKKTPVQATKMGMGDRIRAEIQASVDAGESFTANGVCDAVLTQDPGLNRASVLTSISKLMTTKYAGISYTEERGKGPRPMKMYHPEKSRK